MSYQKILVGVDGSKQADMAFEKAVDIAKTNDAKLLPDRTVHTANC